MKKHSASNCMGYPVFTGKLEDLSGEQKLVVNTTNQYSHCMAEKDDEFRKALMDSDVLLPDGIGIVLASQFLYGRKIKKIAGADLHNFLLKKLDREGGSCFYMGSSKGTLKKIEERIAKEYPNINIASYSPPYKPKFSEMENSQIRKAVNAFRPDVLFVGMTAPKQEKWSHDQRNLLDTKMICSIGAVFDFYAGTVDRPSQFWIDSGMEWLGRLIKEPKRMWRRYILNGMHFGYYLVREKFARPRKEKESSVEMDV